MSQLFVTYLRQGREHHDNEPDGNWDIRRACLETVDEARRRWNEVSDRDPDRHREKDPEGQEAIEKGELSAGQRVRRPDLE